MHPRRRPRVGDRGDLRDRWRRRSRRSRTAPRPSTRSTRSSGRERLRHGGEAARPAASGSTCPPGRARSSSSRTVLPTQERIASDLVAQAEHGLMVQAILTDDGALADRVAALVSDSENVRRARRVARRRDRALGVLRARAPRAARCRPGALLPRIRNAGSVFTVPVCSSATTPPERRTYCRPAASHGRRAGSASRRSWKPLQVVTATPSRGRTRRRGRDRAAGAAEGLPLHAAAAA